MPRNDDTYDLEHLVEELGSQSEVARRLGISQRAVSYYLKGRPMPEPTAREVTRQYAIAVAQNNAAGYESLGATRCDAWEEARGDPAAFSDHISYCPRCLHSVSHEAAFTWEEYDALRGELAILDRLPLTDDLISHERRALARRALALIAARLPQPRPRQDPEV